ncbi:MAG: hypothetical protein B7Z02_01325 [Rhodobacterales bacterium 32-67-9]|nr:MAG: hypothetical protein B7Z02_01325 [Rhodobacterales bacterium 32-67-9]
MALPVDQLVQMLDALIAARARGVRTLQLRDERVEYRTDAEMAAAIADLEARIRRASAPRPGAVLFSSSKGL